MVSFFTKDPSDYLGARKFHFGAKTMYDGRSREGNGSVVLAGGARRVQGSLFVSYLNGHEPRNKGTVRTENATRTALNPQDRHGVQTLGKVVFPLADGNILRAAFETADTDIDTRAFSSRTAASTDVNSDDTMRRRRLSLDQSIMNRGGLTQWSWSLFAQQSDTDQIIDEVRPAAGPTPAVNRHGTLTYSQDTYGGTAQGRKALGNRLPTLLTFGGAYKHDTFDMLRDRIDRNAATGAIVPATNLILPDERTSRRATSPRGACTRRARSAPAGSCWCPVCATTTSLSTLTRRMQSSSPRSVRHRLTSRLAPCRRSSVRRSASRMRSRCTRSTRADSGRRRTARSTAASPTCSVDTRRFRTPT
ncbi:MAG: hypothetical protein QM736_09405 [Vicinamibacterales bacterium]